MKLAYRADKFQDARLFGQQLLDSLDRTHSLNDSQTSDVMFEIADTYRMAGRADDALVLYGRSLTIRERIYGPDHAAVGQVLNMMGRTLNRDGRPAEAEPIFQRLTAIADKLHDPEVTSTTLTGLAAVYYSEGRFADAIPLAERALAERQRTTKFDEGEFATQLGNLSLYYHTVGRDAEAEPLILRALEISQKLRRRSPSILFSHDKVHGFLWTLGKLYRDEGRFAEAEKLLVQVVNETQRLVGPDDIAMTRILIDLAILFQKEGKKPEAEAAYKRAVTIGANLGSDDQSMSEALNDLISLDVAGSRYGDALPYVRQAMARGTAAPGAALPALFGAERSQLVSPDRALDDSLNVVQRAKESGTGAAVRALNARLVSGGGRLGELVRNDQDLTAERKVLDESLAALLGAPAAQRKPDALQNVRDRMVAIAQQREQLNQLFAREFPDYTSLSRPPALNVRDVQSVLGSDEALIVTSLGAKSYVWAISREKAEWRELAASADDVGRQVATMRTQLDPDDPKPFDPQASFALYRKVLGPVEEIIHDKRRLSFVLDGALTSLPPQLLVQSDPTGKDLRHVDWLIRFHAVTVLPSVESLKVLRGRAILTAQQKPLIGFADPVFNPDRPASGVVAGVTASRGIQGTVADLGSIKSMLPQLPETADEVKRIGVVVAADPADEFFGRDATETRVKQSQLDQYRIVYFATHGLLAGDVKKYTKLGAEPALVLSLPSQPTALDDGLLTASEVAQLKLNADWVVLSACNTAAGDKPGAEALSGLARAFFYAGGRSLLVSNWVVESESTVALMTATFAAAADPKLSHAEALQIAMLAMIDNGKEAAWADPKYWAPFVVVGEPAKP